MIETRKLDFGKLKQRNLFTEFFFMPVDGEELPNEELNRIQYDLFVDAMDEIASKEAA